MRHHPEPRPTKETMLEREKSAFRSKLMKVAASYLNEINSNEESDIAEDLATDLPHSLRW